MAFVPEVPTDVTVGEVYRLMLRLENAVRDLGLRLEGKMVTVDVFAITQKQMQDEMIEVKEDLARHLAEETLDDRERKQIRVALMAAMTTAAVSLAVGIGSIVAGLVH